METLADYSFKPKGEKKLSKVVKDALIHCTLYEPTVRQNYTQYLQFALKRHITVRETGLVIQPNLFFTGSPDDLISQHLDSRKVARIEITCLWSKFCKIRNFIYIIIIDKLQLKDHSCSYYTQTQMGMGLLNVDFFKYKDLTLG